MYTIGIDVVDLSDDIQKVIGGLNSLVSKLAMTDVYKTNNELRHLDIKICKDIILLLPKINEKVISLRKAIFAYDSDFNRMALIQAGETIMNERRTITDLAKKLAKSIATDDISSIKKEINYHSFDDTSDNKQKFSKICDDAAEMLRKLDVELFRQSESIGLFRYGQMTRVELVNVALNWNSSPVDNL